MQFFQIGPNPKKQRFCKNNEVEKTGPENALFGLFYA